MFEIVENTTYRPEELSALPCRRAGGTENCTSCKMLQPAVCGCWSVMVLGHDVTQAAQTLSPGSCICVFCVLKLACEVFVCARSGCSICVETNRDHLVGHLAHAGWGCVCAGVCCGVQSLSLYLNCCGTMRKLLGVVSRVAHGVMFCAQALAYCGVCVCGHVQELHVRPPGAS